MSDKATNYQCPSCTGPLHYDGATGRLQCDYCGSSFDPAEIEKLYAEKEQQAASQPETGSDTGEWQSSADEDWGADADKMRVYSCPSCGAQLICEETTAATSCPYCGNPTVIPEQFSGILKPDYILPFKLSKEDAVSALKRHYKGKLLLPKLFRDNNHIEELRGIYVPFWLFDGEAEGSANYMATTTRVFRHGDTEITETSFYEVQRAGTLPLHDPQFRYGRDDRPRRGETDPLCLQIGGGIPARMPGAGRDIRLRETPPQWPGLPPLGKGRRADDPYVRSCRRRTLPKTFTNDGI